MKITPSPSLTKAVTHINNLLNDQSNACLPSVRELAGQIGVSVVTITKAIKRLKKEGLVETIWGKGNFRKNCFQKPLEKNKTTQKHVSKSQLTLDICKQDILNGKFPANHPFPAINQLSSMYNVSYPTIRNVLSKLEHECVIKRNGARYYLHTRKSISRECILVIALGFEPDKVKIEAERERNFYRSLSVAAMQHCVDLNFICYNDYLDTPVFFTPNGETIQAYLIKNDICGIILSSYHMKNSAACLYKIAKSGKPVSIWIEDKEVLQSIEKYRKGYNNITFYDTSYSPIPGEHVGRYLYNKGHRDIAFFSPFHGSPWSKSRLEGLRKFFSDSTHSSINEFTLTDFSNDYAFMKMILDNNSFEMDISVNNVVNKLSHIHKNMINSLEYEYNLLLRNNLILEYCIPLFEKASSTHKLTAWVCANDLVASLAMDYWNYHKVPVNKRPSLIGFDNTFKSLEMGISSYDFNTGGEVNNMLNHLLYPNSAIIAGNKKVIRLNGSVIERASSNRQVKTGSQ